MSDTILLAKNDTSLLDEVDRNASVTTDVISDEALFTAGDNANEIVYPQKIL